MLRPVCILEMALSEEGNPKTRNPESGIRNPESGIRNPESGIRNPESGIRNLENKMGKTKESKFFKSEILGCLVCF